MQKYELTINEEQRALIASALVAVISAAPEAPQSDEQAVLEELNLLEGMFRSLPEDQAQHEHHMGAGSPIMHDFTA